jgi:hypothetical protein
MCRDPQHRLKVADAMMLPQVRREGDRLAGMGRELLATVGAGVLAGAIADASGVATDG